MSDLPPNAVLVHEPHGFVELMDSCATDLDVVNAARASYTNESQWAVDFGDGEVGLSQRDAGLVNYLMKHKHGTPFEQTFFKFRVRAPIFVFREWHRHRIGISINEESGRYVELKGDFYVPDLEHMRIQRGRPGHYEYVSMNEAFGDASTSIYNDATWVMRQSYEGSYGAYEQLLKIGIAKELARCVLPVALYSTMIWSCNARSLMAFLALRNHPRAQREIKDYAAAMETIFGQRMPVTYSAFIVNGRVCP